MAQPQSALRALDQSYLMGIGQGPAPARVPRTRGQTAADMLGAASIGTTPIPIVGDITGMAADAAMYAAYPEERTMGNYAMSALGVLPFVPGVSALRALRDAPSPSAVEAAPPVPAPIDVGHRGSHTTPDADYGAPLNDLTQMMPEDVYGPSGERLYGINNKAIDREVFSALRAARGKPDADVMIYRAVPKDVNAINPGDWVSTSKAYAKVHGENALGGDYRIIEQKAKAGELYMAGDPQEFGWHPKEASAAPSPLEGTLDMSQTARMQRAAEQGFNVDMPVYQSKTEYELAHEVAQRNAAKPISEGGLGLPANNTAMDRANAPGMFPDEAYHFSRHGADVQELDSGKYAVAPFDAVGTHVGSKEQALDRFKNTVGYKVNNPMYANDELKGVTYPLRVNTGNMMLSPDGVVMSETPISMGFSGSADYGDLKTSNEALRETVFSKYDSIPYINEVESPGQISYILPPKNIRSRFAAFDPAKRGSANLMAGAAGATIGLSALRNIQRDEERQPD